VRYSPQYLQTCPLPDTDGSRSKRYRLRFQRIRVQ